MKYIKIIFILCLLLFVMIGLLSLNSLEKVDVNTTDFIEVKNETSLSQLPDNFLLEEYFNYNNDFVIYESDIEIFNRTNFNIIISNINNIYAKDYCVFYCFEGETYIKRNQSLQGNVIVLSRNRIADLKEIKEIEHSIEFFVSSQSHKKCEDRGRLA